MRNIFLYVSYRVNCGCCYFGISYYTVCIICVEDFMKEFYVYVHFWLMYQYQNKNLALKKYIKVVQSPASHHNVSK